MSLRIRQKLGKYRIDGRLAQGGFADVYRAFDTIEGIRVALKIPFIQTTDREAMQSFIKEVRLTAQLDHERILPIKNAEFIGSHFVIVHPLGERNLADRLRTRLSVQNALDYTEQMLAGLAYAHRRRIIHCDVKPENFILFPGDVLKLGDFGIAKMALRTMSASGSGTLGYVAPEQALGRPSFRSDVFSLGLVIYRMLSGVLPEWPFEWPLPAMDRVRRKVSPEMVAMLRRALQVDHRKRFTDAGQMSAAFGRLKKRARNGPSRRRRTTRKAGTAWKEVRHKQFLRRHGKAMESRDRCLKCKGPVSETMTCCPWCAAPRKRHSGDTLFPAQCTRCHRGMKLDWTYCSWCFGPGYEPLSDQEYPDKRYTARCSGPRCSRKLLMPYMRYCPWCRTKVRKKWKVPGSTQNCPRCRWGIYGDFWEHCPWCAKSLRKR